MHVLQKELILPNGTKISNRIAKSAMSENASTKFHEPSQLLISTYKKSYLSLFVCCNISLYDTSSALMSTNQVK